VEKCFIIWCEKQSVTSEIYENNMRMRVTHRFKNSLIIGIIRTVTEDYETHRRYPISPIDFIAFYCIKVLNIVLWSIFISIIEIQHYLCSNDVGHICSEKVVYFCSLTRFNVKQLVHVREKQKRRL